MDASTFKRRLPINSFSSHHKVAKSGRIFQREKKPISYGLNYMLLFMYIKHVPFTQLLLVC